MVMADDRRKPQKQTTPSKSRKKTFLTYGIVLIFLASAYLAGRYYRGHKYDSFAKCLADKQAKMYGLYWCPHCADQKRMFGESFQNIPYIECAIRGSHELAPECKAAGVKLFPSWQFGSEAPKEGVLSLDELSQKTGCKLP